MKDDNQQINIASLGICNAQSVINKLFQRAADNLSNEELEWLSRANDEAEVLARNLSETVQGISFLALADAQHDDQAGNFQSTQDVALLLQLIGQNLEVVAGLCSVGSQSKSRLANPEIYRKTGK